MVRKIVTRKQAPKINQIYMNYAEYLSSDTWREKRDIVVARDGGRCRICNKSGLLNVHHRCYSDQWGNEKIEDLITLCRKCHQLFHSIDQKKNTAPKKTNGRGKLAQGSLSKVKRYLISKGMLSQYGGVKLNIVTAILCDYKKIPMPKTREGYRDLINSVAAGL